MFDYLEVWLRERGWDRESAVLVSTIAAAISLLITAVLSYLLLKIALAALERYWNRRFKTAWSEAFSRHRVHLRAAHILPAILLFRGVPLIFADMPLIAPIADGLTFLYLTTVVVLTIDVMLNAFIDVYRTFPCSRQVPIKGFVQSTKIVIFFIAVVLLLSRLLGQTPVYLLSGLTALTAVLMLIFRDAILGFVAGIQLSTNRMVAQGDWISMPQYGADGDVLEVALTTVKVQNWDKTVTTIPTYALISESFVNWRGMQESGGRRIMRSINIDMSSIKFCNDEMLQRYAKIQYICAYLEQKKKEIAEHNSLQQVDRTCLVNGRHLTNVGTFRAYITAYLRNHPMIHQDMTFLIRHLQPTENGLPIEIYVFCSDTTWAIYEGVQADIFDHILAVVPEFDLKVFQSPSGSDFKELLKAAKPNS